jgi:undecaprenyl diphosphate synthase
VLQAARALARRCQQGALSPDEIDERQLQAELALGTLPDPDLFVRTGGERRISNFLLWNLAYTELYFCDVLWPDFARADLEAALDFFAHRQRRFGMTPAQVSAR